MFDVFATDLLFRVTNLFWMNLAQIVLASRALPYWKPFQNLLGRPPTFRCMFASFTSPTMFKTYTSDEKNWIQLKYQKNNPNTSNPVPKIIFESNFRGLDKWQNLFSIKLFWWEINDIFKSFSVLSRASEEQIERHMENP